MGEDRLSKRAKLDLDSIDANEAILFELQSNGQKLVFKPEMTHQLFGDDEVILGHENPLARIYIDHKSFTYMVTFKSERTRPGATKVEEILSSNFKEGLRSADAKEKHEPSISLPETSNLGEPILRRNQSNSAPISIYHHNLSQSNDKIKAIHARAQQLLLFYIDGATPIDQSEPEWELFTAVQELEDKSTLLLGYCTVYKVYAYPQNSRLRVSQLIVLPPFQKQGIGRMLLEAVYKLADAGNVHDVIFEEPTEEVQALREKIELDRCRLSPWLRDLAVSQGESSRAMNGHASEQLPASLALSAKELAQAQKELHIPKQQVRCLWETLLMQQAAFQKEPGQFPLRGLVARRLIGKFADTEQQAVGKQIFTFPDGHSFCMRKVPRSAGIKGAPVALEDKKEEGQSKEEREEAFDQAVEERMQFLYRLAGLAA